MSRGNRRAAASCAVVLALGGCMRIYPDPDLPDVVIEWSDTDCVEGSARVRLSLHPADAPSTVSGMLTVPCADRKASFVDVARERYQLKAAIEDDAGELVSTYDDELDLRNGRNVKRSAYFGGSPLLTNLRVGWTFAPGVSCESLAATSVSLRFADPAADPAFALDVPCDPPVYLGWMQRGRFTLSAAVLAGESVVATSPATEPLDISAEAVTDFGTLTLSPCGEQCP